MATTNDEASAGAHGYFQAYRSHASLTRASFLADPHVRTPAFVRFSTVAGTGAVDLPREVLGFAVKLYTDEGHFDLVGNNFPVFFIKDAIKLPDLIHAVKKMEPDRAPLHDAFWDFVSRMPESMHMVMWAMSDRAIPRSLRMIEGFGIHTFRMVTADGRRSFVKFHLRPKIGAASVLWDEAVRLFGADPDAHWRDLYEAIARGDCPEWELSVQAFDEATSNALPFDVLDRTKLIPEEVVPLTPLGKLVLDRIPDEREQVIFHSSHIVPGIDYAQAPLLTGHLDSRLDTQLSGLSRPLASATARESRESAVDCYSQARLFFRSMTDVEQRHIIDAFALELGKVDSVAIRRRVLGHLALIDAALLLGVSDALGMVGQAEIIEPACMPIDLPESPSLSLLKKARPTIEGRKIGVLVAEGVDGALLTTLREQVEQEGAVLEVVAPKITGVTAEGGEAISADHALAAAPSIFFDAVVVLAEESGASTLAENAPAIEWIREAHRHLKVIGYSDAATDVLEAARITVDEAVMPVGGVRDVRRFIERAESGRQWARADAL